MATALHVSILKFNQGNYIMIQGKQNMDVFFFIKEGKVELIHQDLEFKTEQESERILLEEGDFFGVISCMSGHPREESAIAVTNVVLIQVKRDQFGALIKNNAHVALRIIMSFSKRLRRLNDETIKSEQDASKLYDIAELCVRDNLLIQAFYIYKRYLEYCPDGEHVENVKKKLEDISSNEEVKNSYDNDTSNALIKKFKNDEIVFCEYEKGDALFILQKGQVKIVKVIDNNAKVLDVLKSGDIFGEMAILEKKPRVATAVALGNVELMMVTESNFQSMVMNQPQLATKLITVLSERLWLTYRQIVSSSIENPLGRLLDTLLLQVEKARIPIQKNSSHQFNFGVNELIGMSGLDVSVGKDSVSKMLENKRFVLTGKKQFVQCLDLEELRKEVEVIYGMERREAGRKK